MKLNETISKMAMIGFFIFIIVLWANSYTEWTGFFLMYVWFISSYSFLFANTNTKMELNPITTSIILLFVSSTLVILSIWKLYREFSKKSLPIHLKGSRREALNNYKIIYIICQVFVFIKILVPFSDTLSTNYIVTVLLFLLLWLPNQVKYPTSLTPFLVTFFITLVILFFSCIQNPFLPCIYHIILTMSAYLVYIGNWIFHHSRYTIGL